MQELSLVIYIKDDKNICENYLNKIVCVLVYTGKQPVMTYYEYFSYTNIVLIEACRKTRIPRKS